MVPMKNQVHCQTEDNNTPKKWHFSMQRWTLCIYPFIYSRTQDTVKIKKYFEYTEKKTTKETLLLGIWNDLQNPESTWYSRIFTEKSSTTNICLITTSLRLAADRHSSSFCQNILGDTSLTRCALGGPLHVTTHTFATESSTEYLLLPTRPASIPLNSCIWIHFLDSLLHSLPWTSVPGSDCHGCTVTFILPDI